MFYMHTWCQKEVKLICFTCTCDARRRSNWYALHVHVMPEGGQIDMFYMYTWCQKEVKLICCTCTRDARSRSNWYVLHVHVMPEGGQICLALLVQLWIHFRFQSSGKYTLIWCVIWRQQLNYHSSCIGEKTNYNDNHKTIE